MVRVDVYVYEYCFPAPLDRLQLQLEGKFGNQIRIRRVNIAQAKYLPRVVLDALVEEGSQAWPLFMVNDELVWKSTMPDAIQFSEIITSFLERVPPQV